MNRIRHVTYTTKDNRMDLCVSLWVDYCLVNILVEWIHVFLCE
jgi:hypothetical protein